MASMAGISGQTIKAYRDQLLLSQADFSRILECSQSTISMIEVGQNAVSRKFLRSIRLCGERGKLTPTLEEFLRSGGLRPGAVEAELGVSERIPLQTWGERIDLTDDPVDRNVEWMSIPGISPGSRAFRFTPASEILLPDTFAVFQSVTPSIMLGGEIVLLQLRKGTGGKGIADQVAHLGRVIVTGRGKARSMHVEPANRRTPLIGLADRQVEVLMACCFRGRYCPS